MWVWQFTLFKDLKLCLKHISVFYSIFSGWLPLQSTTFTILPWVPPYISNFRTHCNILSVIIGTHHFSASVSPINIIDNLVPPSSGLLMVMFIHLMICRFCMQGLLINAETTPETLLVLSTSLVHSNLRMVFSTGKTQGETKIFIQWYALSVLGKLLSTTWSKFKACL